MANSPIAIARALHAALEAGQHGQALREHFTADATALEHPNAIRPKGGTADLAQMLAGSEAGAHLLTKQQYALVGAIEQGDLAVLRVRWTGAVARDVGQFRAGQVLVAHLAQFVTTRDGRIASIETYDCYEPF